ncbi:MAG: argininosuccinate lyase [Planctomycetaceae bacterium]|nr:argininosuccinate lyase [Planctomycetaceae bacterium]
MSSPSRSGAFAEQVDRRLEKFSESISFDHRLVIQDINGSIAHAKMLATQRILTDEEAAAICRELEIIGGQIQNGEIPLRAELEDIHMHVEKALIDRLGDVGRKLHTARSRNDQISTDFRLWIRDSIDRVDLLLLELQKAFVQRCTPDLHVIIPAYTHTQRAQPVLAAHYWLAYCEKLERDRERLRDCRHRVNRSPLGGAAVAGTSLNIDRYATARMLGFEEVMANSLDISSDRDFVLETAFCLTTIMLHLSTWAEEWILWSTTEFDFIELPHAFCTGSSIMPQKVNPDTIELIRGKSARVVGNLQQAIVLLKGLPLAYNRDLQEDKQPLFDSFETVEACLELAIPVVAQSKLKIDSIATRLEDGYLDATTLMEYLMKRGLPQRQAHHAVGSLVRAAMQQKLQLRQLPLSAFQELDPTLDSSVFDILGTANAIQSFQSYGSTAPNQVQQQIDEWKKSLGLTS